MRLFLLLAAVLISCAWAEKSSRAKRFAAFGSLSTVGGRVGCVVSQNKLFINGHFTKDLSEDEQEELKQYREALDQFKEEAKQFLEERQKVFAAAAGRQQPGAEVIAAEGKMPKKPEPPKKPSFCSDKATTQYVFDGCSVQGDNVFIGDTFVRKLSPAELQELEQFDRQFTAYQKAISADIRKKVEEAFGQHFGSLFGLGAQSSSSERNKTGGGGKAGEQQQQAAAAPAAGGAAEPNNNGTAPEAPKTPSFCTLIV